MLERVCDHADSSVRPYHLCILTAPGRKPDPALVALAAAWQRTGTVVPMSGWEAALPEWRIAWVDGRHHDLWWEFALKHSFRWQAHLCGLDAGTCRRRTLDMALRFGLVTALEERVEDLTPSERARADLAVALLSDPDLLIWEEPFALIPAPDRPLLIQAVWGLVLTEGLTVVAASQTPDGLAGLQNPGRQNRQALL